MNKNSYLCNLINENPDVWREICRYRKIKVKESGNLAIFNYDIMADFKDPYVQEARGIIIDTKSCDVVCFPFRKFGNYHESYADKIDWNSAKVQEKVDGSIIKLWFCKDKDMWQWSSNSCIDAKDAALSSGYNIYGLITKTKEYDHILNLIKNDAIDPGYTYIFELVSPKNQVVVKYDETKLYHIGTRENTTGKELGTGCFRGYIASPKEYPLKSFDECLKAVKELNKKDYPDNEGFVVVDKDFHRIKIKSPEYLIYHHAINNNQLTNDKVWELLHTDDFNIDTFIENASEENAEFLKKYINIMNDILEEIGVFIKDARSMQDKGMSRKDIALSIKDNDFSYFGFKALNKEITYEDLMESFKNDKALCKIIDKRFKLDRDEEKDLDI